MEYLYYYIIFALSGAFLSVFEILNPVRRSLKQADMNDHMYVRSPIITITVWFVLAAICAPFLIRPLLSEKSKNVFISTLLEGATED